MDGGLTWQSLVTLAACLVTCVVVPLIVWGAAIWSKVGRLEEKLTSTVESIKRIESAQHACPYVQIRTEHHEQLANHERRMAWLEDWRKEIDRMLIRMKMMHGEESES